MKRSMLVAAIFFILFVSNWSQGAQSANTLPSLSAGQKAPDFSLENLEGEIVKLSDFKGEKVIVNFWAAWCPSCREEIPVLKQFYSQYRDDVKILTINIDPSEDLHAFVKQQQISFPVLLDQGGKTGRVYQLTAVPTTYFVDEKGIIRHVFLGVPTVEKLREYSGL